MFLQAKVVAQDQQRHTELCILEWACDGEAVCGFFGAADCDIQLTGLHDSTLYSHTVLCWGVVSAWWGVRYNYGVQAQRAGQQKN